MNKDKLIEEANKKYKIGTIFKSEFSDHGKLREVQPYIGNTTVTYKCFQGETGIIRCGNGMYFKDINKQNVCSNPIVYQNGEWAEIVTSLVINGFKKDDYIIFTKVERTSGNFPLNFIFKQRNNSHYLCPYLDAEGLDDNEWEYHRNFSKSYKGYETDWRYATSQEIAEYDRLGKPYDVTILQQKISNILNYIECTQESKYYFGKLGEIYKVTGKCGYDYYIEGSTTGSVAKSRFKPSTEEAYNKQNNLIVEKKEEIKYYKILKDSCGYKKGDIGKVIIIDDYGFQLFVPNRKSDSCYTPNVYFQFHDIEESTKEAFLEQQQEELNFTNTQCFKFPKKAITCTTEEQFKFVIEKSNSGISLSCWNQFKENTCINCTDYQNYDKNDFYRNKGYHIISFDEWSEQCGYNRNWIPQVGEYTIMEKAGGWSFPHENNGCLAIITSIGQRNVSNNEGKENIYPSISGKLLNPKVNRYIEFNNVPITNGEKVICRKATEEEIEKVIGKLDKSSDKWIPEVGNWCYILNKWDSKLNINKVYKINQVEPDKHHGFIYHFDIDSTNLKSNSCWLRQTDFRKAEDHEIPRTINVHSKINRRIRKGDKLYCHTSLVMLKSGIIEATKGQIYESQYDGTFINNSGNIDHCIPEASKYFDLITEYTGGMDLNDNIIENIGTRPQRDNGGRPIITGTKGMNSDIDFSKLYRDSDNLTIGARGYGKAYHQEQWIKQQLSQFPLTLDQVYPRPEKYTGLWSQIQKEEEEDISIQRIKPISPYQLENFKKEILDFYQEREELSTQSINKIEVLPPKQLTIIK